MKIYSQFNPSYYEILEVPFNATISKIKKSYRRLSLRKHPDTSTEKDATAIQQKLNEAKDVLTNEVNRKEYEKQLTQYQQAESAKRQEAKEYEERRRREKQSQRPKAAFVPPFDKSEFTWQQAVFQLLILLIIEFAKAKSNKS